MSFYEHHTPVQDLLVFRHAVSQVEYARAYYDAYAYAHERVIRQFMNFYNLYHHYIKRAQAEISSGTLLYYYNVFVIVEAEERIIDDMREYTDRGCPDRDIIASFKAAIETERAIRELQHTKIKFIEWDKAIIGGDITGSTIVTGNYNDIRYRGERRS